MSLFVLDEFEMALSQSEKLARKRKTEVKSCKCIMEDLELHDARNKKCWRWYVVAKQKRKVRKHRRKLSKPSYSNGEPDTDGKESFKFAAKSSCFLSFWFCFWVLHFSCWASITFFDGFLSFFFCLPMANHLRHFSLRALWSSDPP